MGFSARTILVAIALSSTGPSATLAFGQDGSTDPIRTLFLGNSVFNYQGGIAQSYEGFCQAASIGSEVASQIKKPSHSHGIEFLDFGRIPLNLPEVAASNRLHEIIRSGNYDFVVLEARRSGYLLPEHARLPTDRGEPIPYAENLEALIQLHRSVAGSGAKLAIYMHPGLHLYPDIKHPIAQIYTRLKNDLERTPVMGSKRSVILIPALYLWLDATRRFGVGNWYADPGHGNALARYASGCLVFTYLTGRDPRRIPFNELPRTWDSPPEAKPAYAAIQDAQWIKSQVWLYFTTRIGAPSR